MQDQPSSQAERDFELKWRLSARASCFIWKTATRFNSSIEFTHGEESADAKSIMSVHTLGALKLFRPALEAGDVSSFSLASWTGLKAGSLIKIIARGTDAADALAAMIEVLSRGDLDFG